VDLQGPRRLGVVVGSPHPDRDRWVLGSSGGLPERLTQEKFGQIRRAIRHEMWRKAFPSMSWRTLQEVPHSLCVLATSRIREVELLGGSPDLIQVRTQSRFGDYFFMLERGPVRRLVPTHTEAGTIGFGAPAELKRQPILTEAGFADSLSNHATLFSR